MEKAVILMQAAFPARRKVSRHQESQLQQTIRSDVAEHPASTFARHSLALPALGPADSWPQPMCRQ
jgi:hypothetical protein